MNKGLNMEYNTARPKMLIPEYGRNVQKMVDFAVTIDDKEERNKVANAIINVMGELKQHLRDDEDYRHKLWTHLFIMSDFKLDVDSPYPIPQKENINIKPDKMPYPQHKIKYGHYGKSIEKLIDAACKIPESDKKIALIKVIANMMKKFHLMYHTNSIDESVIMLHLEKLSDGQLKLDDLSFFTDTKEILKVVGSSKNNGNNRNNRNNKNRNKNNRNRRRY